MAQKTSPKDIKTVYLITGEIDSRRDEAVRELIAQVVDDESSAFDLEKLDGLSSSAENILTAAAMMPLMSDRKVVLVDRVDRLPPDDQVRIANFVPKLGPRSCLIMLVDDDTQRTQAPSRDSEDESDAESSKRKRKKGLQPELTKAVKTHGELITFGRFKSDSLNAHVAKAVAARGKKIEPSALEAVTRSLSADPAMIESEIEKLTTYVGDRDRVTVRDVNAIVTISPDDRIFQLIDAIATRQPSQALRLLGETFAASAKPDTEVLRMLAMMAKRFRLLYQAKYLQDQGVRNLSDVPDELKAVIMQDKGQNPLGGSDWQQRKTWTQARSFSYEDLRRCLRLALECETSVKGLGRGEASPRLNLELLVLRLSHIKTRRQ